VGATEDRHHETGVDGVHHVGDPVLAHQRCDRGGVRGVDPRGHEPVVAEGCDRLLGAGRVVVGHDAGLEEVAAGGDGGEGRADASGTDEQDPHAHSPK